MSDRRRSPAEQGQPKARRPSRAEIARTRYLSRPPEPPAHSSPAPTAAPRPGLRIAVVLLYPLVLLSLGLNVMLIRELLKIRDQALQALDQTADQVMAMTAGIEDEVISIPIQVDETFPVSVSVPFAYNTTIPIDMDVPIKTTFKVPFEVAGTTINLDVPVDMSVPIYYEVPVSLERTFDINTTVPVKFNMNVEVRLADTALPAYLAELRTAVQEIKKQVHALSPEQ